MQVSDQSKPEKFGQSQVLLTVTRNTSPPSFDRPQYGAPINYNKAPGLVATTQASDPDLSVSRFTSTQKFMPSTFIREVEGEELTEYSKTRL